MKVTLNEDQIKMLEAWANELPTKYGMSFIQFLAAQVQEQTAKEEEEKIPCFTEGNIPSFTKEDFE